MRISSNIALAATVLSSAAFVAAAPAPAPAGALDNIPAFHRVAAFEGLGAGLAPAKGPNGLAPTSPKDIAVAYVTSKHGLKADDLEVTDDYTSDGIRNIYFKRVLNGARVGNQHANVSIKDGKVVAFGSNIPTAQNALKPTIPAAAAKVSADAAVAAAEKSTGLKLVPEVKPFNRYIETGDGKFEYTWSFQVKSADNGKNLQWYQVDVSADTGKIVHSTSFVNHASYNVVKFTAKAANPTKDQITVTDPADQTASPNGWHNDGTTSYTDTRGNNAVVYTKSGSTKTYAQGGANNVYSTPYNVNQAANTASNKIASTVNLFYITNEMHDLFYKYGFDEASGNFQTSNGSKGGKGGDAVQVSAQDPGGTDNANMATPPDGQKPQMNMYVFTQTSPTRDGGLENAIPIHEFTHGISNRLTGGPSNTNCLETLEAGGMGEGWSDAASLIVSYPADATADDDMIVGAWVMNKAGGIRSQPYSTSLTRNTYKYSDVGTLGEVHDIGEIWATLWHELYWNLRTQGGYSADIFNPNQDTGNIAALHLFIDHMKLQPCSPTFVTARNAIIQADQNRYQGKYKCAIWKAFAKRGVGAKAVSGTYTNDFSVPAECSGGATSTARPTSTVRPTSTSAPVTTVVPTSTRATSTTRPTSTRKPTPTPTPKPEPDCSFPNCFFDDNCDTCTW
ncbi:Fungalysin metallopeptidase-domain-containing protein [Fimicolochytrium jonesii]|uniref:Fungalysin metallopeptidase-domain-containing protein n=1 Tax=Fimicolochytrium jonesii TaxID=1396493 RepID=UPI0022FEEFA8|nr:Fungalysin metallopeptidase-domain-containing protein [Fimicolochytrium jonesii]KAI8821042.1 Fungalysin metallopeptidase-domain-containing protein [Fimicolochytrium jonesii]